MERALQKFSKKINNFEECMVTPTFYVVKWKWQAYSISDWFLVTSKTYLCCILAKPGEGCQSL